MSNRKTKKAVKKTSLLHIQNAAMTEGWRERVEDEMKKQRMSQRRLATEAGLGSTTVRHVLKVADTTTLSTLERIANALNVPVQYLSAGIRDSVDRPDEMSPQHIKLISVGEGDNERIVAVVGRAARRDSDAIMITDHAMQNYGNNEIVDPSLVLNPGDVAIFAYDESPMPGQLAVVSVKGGVAVRLLAENDEGEKLAVALNANFARVRLQDSDVIGAVLETRRAEN